MNLSLRNLLLVICSAGLSLVYFLISTGIWKTEQIQISGLGQINFISFIHTVLALLQLGLLLIFIEGILKLKGGKIFLIIISLILLIDGINLVLMKVYATNSYIKIVYYAIHALVVYLATGLSTVFYFLMNQYLPREVVKVKSIEPTDMISEKKISLMTMFTNVVITMGIIFVVWCFKNEYWKLGGVLFLLSLIIFGFVNRWSQRVFSKIESRNVWIMYLLSVIFGLIGGWHDFFTGFLFFFSAFGILILTSSRREVSLGRILISIATICFGVLLLVFHFIYSMG